MPPILVPSFAKRIATRNLVSEKLNGRKDFILRDFVCDINIPSKELTCLGTEAQEQGVKSLRMKSLERYQWRRSSVYNVNCEHISNFLLIIDFEQSKFCRVHIEKINTFEDKIRDQGWMQRATTAANAAPRNGSH